MFHFLFNRESDVLPPIREGYIERRSHKTNVHEQERPLPIPKPPPRTSSIANKLIDIVMRRLGGG